MNSKSIIFHFESSMLRSHSTDYAKCSYENISSRLNRLRNATPSDVLKPSPSIAPSHGSILGYRNTLKVDENGIFTSNYGGKVGKVSKNTGVRKYNERMIREAVTKNINVKSPNEGNYKYNIKGRQSPLSNHVSRSKSHSRSRNTSPQNIKYIPYEAVNLHMSPHKKSPQKNQPSPKLIAGRIYSTVRIKQIMNEEKLL